MQESRLTSSSHSQIEHFLPSEAMHRFGHCPNLTQARIWKCKSRESHQVPIHKLSTDGQNPLEIKRGDPIYKGKP